MSNVVPVETTSSTKSVNGFYAAYLSGRYGQGFAMLIFRNGVIAGADTSGVLFDGRYSVAGTNDLAVTLLVKSPPNVSLIQGGMTGPEGDETRLSFHMPQNFASHRFVRIEGSRGPVNAKIVKLRDLDE